MKIKLPIKKKWLIAYGCFLLKILLFYYLVGFNGIDYIVGLLTFAFFVLTFEQMKRRRHQKLFASLFSIGYGLISILMMADVMYYGYFVQYTSVNQIFQIGNLLETSEAIDLNGIISVVGILIFLWDIPLVISCFIQSQKRYKEESERKIIKQNQIGEKIFSWIPNYCFIGFFIGLVLLTWNPFQDVSIAKITNLEFVSYHTHDIVNFVVEEMKRSSIDKEEIQEELQALVPKTEGNKYKGIGEGKNLIVIQMESFQNFPIGRFYNGQELTPNINKLLKEDTLYFSNYYQTLGKGNTADAEFSTLNSFYPVTERESYRLYVENNYNGLPWLLRSKGYRTLAFHGNVRTFWNRGQMYPQEGFDYFYSQEYLDATEISGFGITDKELFRQAVDILKVQTKPTFSFMVTVTNHIPYDLDDSLVTLELEPEDENLFGHYLQSVHYADEAIGELIQRLKEEGVYENTVIAMYGDHHGMLLSDDDFYQSIQENVPKYTGREYDYDEMLNIPLIIHIPNSGVCETIDTVGGEVDFLPTIANIMNLTIPQPYIFGKDIVNVTDDRDSFVASVTYLLEGSFVWNHIMYQIGRDGSFESGRAWNTDTGEEVPLTKELKEQSERARRLVQLSKTTLDYNLMSEYAGQNYVSIDEN